jgi:heme exporter protein A
VTSSAGIAAEALLECRGVACEREGRQLFRDLELTVNAGECVILTGPNGSGKSTLLRCITGLFPDYEGEINVGSLAYLGHRPGVSLALSPLENLRWYASLQEQRGDLQQLLARVGLQGYEGVLCQNLSAGQQRRVALARLLLDPEGGAAARLWLLDEPFTALDPSGQDLVRTIIVEHVRSGGAAVCATHQALEIPDTVSLRLGEVTERAEVGAP